MNIQTVKNVNDCVPLYLPHSLYLKPFARLNISVSLPQAAPSKTISNWDIMEKLRKIIVPEQFSSLKVSKNTLEFIRFDADLDEFTKLKNVLDRLDGSSIKISAFSDPLKIRAAQARDNFPTRHDWDSFFRDARGMDEMKPGERPDTIHISNLPIRWFCPRHAENDENVKPSESIFKRIFEKFGEVRLVDIPICDPYRKDMKAHITGMKTFSFDQELYFEGYVQFNEYLGFVKAMNEFRGMKLVRKEGEKNFAANIAMDFDRTKHLSDASIRRRKILRDRLIAKDVAKGEEEKKKLQEEEEKKAAERQREEAAKMAEIENQRKREEKRKEKHLKKLKDKEHEEISLKIRNEEKKLIVAQRKLESIRILEALFERIKMNPTKKIKVEKQSKKVESNHFAVKAKHAQQFEINKLKKSLKKVKTEFVRSPSVNSISSNDSVLSDSAQKKKKKVKKRNSDSSSSALSSEKETSTGLMAPTAPGHFPLFNPQTGQWMGMPMGIVPYPSTFLPPGHMIRPEFFNPFHGYRGMSRGRFRGRGRGGSHRGHNAYNSYDSHENRRRYSDDHDDRASRYSKSRSRSNSRRKHYSKSRSRSRSTSRYRRSKRSRSRSKSRRSYSRSRSRSRSRSKNRSSRSHARRSRSKSRSKSKHSKLVSTLRKSSSDNRWSSRSRSRSRSRSKRSWSRNRSRSHSKSRSYNGDRRNSDDRDRSKNVSSINLEPEKLVMTAKEIQRSVQQKLHERMQKLDAENRDTDEIASDKVNEKMNESSIKEKE